MASPWALARLEGRLQEGRAGPGGCWPRRDAVNERASGRAGEHLLDAEDAETMAWTWWQGRRGDDRIQGGEARREAGAAGSGRGRRSPARRQIQAAARELLGLSMVACDSGRWRARAGGEDELRPPLLMVGLGDAMARREGVEVGNGREAPWLRRRARFAGADVAPAVDAGWRCSRSTLDRGTGGGNEALGPCGTAGSRASVGLVGWK